MKRARRIALIATLIGALAVWLTLLARERLYREGENYTLIEPGLYLGGHTNAPPPGTRAVLNLCESEDPYQCEAHAWEPIRDAAPAPSLKWLEEQIDFVALNRNKGHTVYVHCRHGVSRSGMVVTAYLMRKHGWTRDEAIASIQEKRPPLRPNPAFMELLAEWENPAIR